MRRSELAFVLPPELIAQHPPGQRRESRLLVVDRARGTWTDEGFPALARHLAPPDVLVINNTRVVPARFFLRRASGGRVEALWLRDGADGTWEVLLRGGRSLGISEVLGFEGAEDLRAEILDRGQRGQHTLRVTPPGPSLEILQRVGCAPLPPYIKRPQRRAQGQDLERYQTVYARRAGAVAAPTAGVHFDEALLQELTNKGVEIVEVTLHVGWGTFAPIEAEELTGHALHAEWMEVLPEAAQVLRRARESGRRLVAVGSTAARVLETLALTGKTTGPTDLFIYPPYRFQWVGALITNFHLPHSTLLALVYAFGGTELIRQAYAHAVGRRYRFYSYGDAMLIT